MSSSTALILFGLLIALAGVAGILLARAQPAAGSSGSSGSSDSLGEELSVATDFEGVARALRSVDRRVSIGVAVAVAGLLLAGVGAYLASDARALGTDVGGAGTSDDNRVGGSW